MSSPTKVGPVAAESNVSVQGGTHTEIETAIRDVVGSKGEESIMEGAALGDDSYENNAPWDDVGSEDELESVVIITDPSARNPRSAKKRQNYGGSNSYEMPTAVENASGLSGDASSLHAGAGVAIEGDSSEQEAALLKSLRFPTEKTAFDVDLDSSTNSYRPWRLHRVDISNYFNYGLNEASWRGYCLQQLKIRAERGEGPLPTSASTVGSSAGTGAMMKDLPMSKPPQTDDGASSQLSAYSNGPTAPSAPLRPNGMQGTHYQLPASSHQAQVPAQQLPPPSFQPGPPRPPPPPPMMKTGPGPGLGQLPGAFHHQQHMMQQNYQQQPSQQQQFQHQHQHQQQFPNQQQFQPRGPMPSRQAPPFQQGVPNNFGNQQHHNQHHQQQGNYYQAQINSQGMPPQHYQQQFHGQVQQQGQYPFQSGQQNNSRKRDHDNR